MIMKIDRDLERVDAKIEEMRHWLKAYDDDPNFGEYIKDDKGRRVPRLPTFKSVEEMRKPGTAANGMSLQETLAAREFRAKDDAINSARWMDGKSPYGKV